MPEHSERRPPAVGDFVHFVFEYRPRAGTVVALEPRGEAVRTIGAGPWVQVSTSGLDPAQGMPTWNVPVTILGADAPTLAELFMNFGEHVAASRGAATGERAWDRLMATAARQELDRRTALAQRDPAAPMALSHLNGTKRSVMRELTLIMIDRQKEGHDA